MAEYSSSKPCLVWLRDDLRLGDNPALAEYMQVGVVDQAGGYERLSATEQGLERAEMARRAKEVEAASRNADAPTL